ncbi:MAG TPA: TIGR02270 family protein [Myxococcaceae bacterium]|nr:TIGR02270 family protein [Myxococcaceae bacterium]
MAPRTAPLPVLWDAYEEHLDEAEFLWTQWERMLVSADDRLQEVEESEERLFAHLDGLVLGGSRVVERLLVPALQEDVPARSSAAAFALASGGLPAAGEALLSCLNEEAPVPLSAIQRAFELIEREALPAWLPSLLDASSPALRALAIDLLSNHREVPARLLSEGLSHESPRVVSATLRAMSRSRLLLDRATLGRVLESTVPEVRDAAIVAGLVGGQRAAWSACLETLGAPEAKLSRLLVAMGADERELGRLLALLDAPKLREEVLWALGFSGQLAAADTCVALMEDEASAALAAEAFCAITGLRLDEGLAVERTEPPEEPVPLEEEDLDATLEPSVEEALPLPDAPAVARWWREARPRFEVRQRYLRGRILETDVLLKSLEREPMRRRHVLALEVMIRSRGAVQLPTRFFARQQLEALRTLRAAPPLQLNRSITDGLTA